MFTITGSRDECSFTTETGGQAHFPGSFTIFSGTVGGALCAEYGQSPHGLVGASGGGHERHVSRPAGVNLYRILLKANALRIAFGLIVYGSYANILAVLMAAATGSGKMMPLAGGLEGNLPEEGVVSFLLVTLALAMVGALLLVLIGFYRGMRRTVGADS